MEKKAQNHVVFCGVLSMAIYSMFSEKLKEKEEKQYLHKGKRVFFCTRVYYSNTSIRI